MHQLLKKYEAGEMQHNIYCPKDRSFIIFLFLGLLSMIFQLFASRWWFYYTKSIIHGSAINYWFCLLFASWGIMGDYYLHLWYKNKSYTCRHAWKSHSHSHSVLHSVKALRLLNVTWHDYYLYIHFSLCLEVKY